MIANASALTLPGRPVGALTALATVEATTRLMMSPHPHATHGDYLVGRLADAMLDRDQAISRAQWHWDRLMDRVARDYQAEARDAEEAVKAIRREIAAERVRQLKARAEAERYGANRRPGLVARLLGWLASLPTRW